ncbi:MAG: hypothetical protein BWY50_01606 [Spirochaetes bacterium ADurb.Bin315]|nr:MAG: hypothetical protein BWY50_01606 [Spirochaetes bacterium ADurb.Bin315]
MGEDVVVGKGTRDSSVVERIGSIRLQIDLPQEAIVGGEETHVPSAEELGEGIPDRAIQVAGLLPLAHPHPVRGVGYDYPGRRGNVFCRQGGEILHLEGDQMIDAGFSCRFLCDADRLGAAVPSMDGKRFLFHPGDDLVNDLFIEIHVMDREVENGKDPGFHEAGSTPGRPERSFNDDRSRAAEGVEQGGKGARFVGKLAPLGAIEEGKGEVFSKKSIGLIPPVSSLVVALTAEIDEPRRPIFFQVDVEDEVAVITVDIRSSAVEVFSNPVDDRIFEPERSEVRVLQVADVLCGNRHRKAF